jgi:anaerobic glycerol-3-phosphate dehydrogenase
MKYTDIAIIGGGLAGSTAPAMLDVPGLQRCRSTRTRSIRSTSASKN